MSAEKYDNQHIAYLHGRPDAHPLHKSFARSITNNHFYVDAPIRWQDRSYSVFALIFIWIFNALFFPYRRFRLFLVDNLHFSVIFYKLFFRAPWRKQRFIVHLGSHTLYFMKTEKFTGFNLRLHKWALSKYDALICEGLMAERFAKEILGEKCPPTFVTFLGPLTKRRDFLNAVRPDLESQQIVIIASGPSDFRFFYKGMDLMLSAVSLVCKKFPMARFKILGNWDMTQIRQHLDESLLMGDDPKVSFSGYVADLSDFLSKSALCIHMSRGDAFPTATLEAMSAGIPCIVSDVTGTCDIVNSVDKEMVLPLDAYVLANAISRYFTLSAAERLRLSDAFRLAASDYTEENAVNHYQDTFKKIMDLLNAKK